MIHRRVLAAIALLLVTVVSLAPSSVPASASSADPASFRTEALASLRAGYDVLLTGRAQALVPDQNELGAQRSGDERLAATLYRRDFNARYGVLFTAIDVALTLTAVRTEGSRTLVDADEDVEIQSTSARGGTEVTRMRIPHTFVFVQDAKVWRLKFDQAGGMRNHGAASDPNPQIPAAGLAAQSNVAGGHVGSLIPGEETTALSFPDGNGRAVTAYGTYWPNPAGDYAYNWALSRNPSYRNFSPDDCTNFVSQALRAGGWTDKAGWKYDWNNWWYADFDQTTSWTYVPALRQFMSTSGRAQALAYLNNLLKGDVVQVDFHQDGSWDHSMMVDAAYSTNLADIFVSYHDTDTQHRRLSDFFAAVNPSTYNAWHIIFTSN